MRFPLVVLIVVITYCSVVVPSAWSQSSPPDLQLATAAATILYFPFKAAFALGVESSVDLPMCFLDSVRPRRKVFGSPACMGPTLLRRSISVLIVRYVLWALQPKVRGCQPPRRRQITEGGRSTCARYERVLTAASF